MLKHTFKLLAIALVLSVSVVARPVPGQFSAALSGPNESPANASLGPGVAVVTYEGTTIMLQVQVTFSGLTGSTTASHIHAATPTPGTGTAGVATTTPTFAGFPLGVTSGSYFNILDLTLLSSYNPAYVTANGGTASRTGCFHRLHRSRCRQHRCPRWIQKDEERQQPAARPTHLKSWA